MVKKSVLLHFGASLVDKPIITGLIRDYDVVFPTKNLIWQEAKCTHCGSCVGQCFPDALHINNETGLVLFKHELCVACGLCIPACPFGALESVDQHVAASQK